MSRIYRIFMICFLPSAGLAQVTGSSFEIYDTPYEQEILSNSSSSNLELLMALGPNASAARTKKFQSNYEVFVGKIKSSKLMKLPEEKLVNALHSELRKEFLVQYKQISPFHEIMESGTYNCVSSAALLALVLEDLNIPYLIQEMPEHVNIIAYPESKSVLIEMTAVNNVKIAPSQKYISMVATSIVEMGIVSEQVLKTQGQNAIYHQYINKSKGISLRQLAGVQYFNEAHVAFDSESNQLALKNALKMELLYPGELANIYPKMLHNDYFKVNYFYLLTLTSNYFYTKNSGNEGNSYFENALKTYYSIDDKEIVDEEYLGRLYAEQGTFLYRKKDYKGALKTLDEGLRLSPDHERLIERRKIVLKYVN